MIERRSNELPLCLFKRNGRNVDLPAMLETLLSARVCDVFRDWLLTGAYLPQPHCAAKHPSGPDRFRVRRETGKE